MSNYDDYDPSIHRSRVAKKKQEEAALLEKEANKKKLINSKKNVNVVAKLKDILAITIAFFTALFQSVKALISKVVVNLKVKLKNNGEKKKNMKTKQDKKDKKPVTKKRIALTILKYLICFGLICVIFVTAYVGITIIRAPKIDTSDLDSLLTQSSVLYDDQGNIMDTAFADQNRTSVEISQVPKYVQLAFVSLEDKTFYKHHGFNIVRIIGAVVDSVFGGGQISGTSTITQQLARNLFLSDIMSERSLSRKIIEAYYAVILENNLTKDEILEGYLNTINFGLGYGIQTASQSYFSKDVSELTIAEGAALASLPQAPSAYALVKIIDIDNVTEDTENLLFKDKNYGYVWNNAAKDRINLCLALMKNNGTITEEEYTEAVNTEIKDMVNPNFSAIEADANYFADYVIETVINDLQTEYGYTYETAHDLVYNGGLRIYTTMDAKAQEVCETEFANDKNFPVPTSYQLDKDGNMLTPKQYQYDENGEKQEFEQTIMLYNLKNYVEDDGYFKLKTSEFIENSDGSITLIYKKRLAFYQTTVNGTTDISIEFRPMYAKENGKLYSIPNAYLNIPQQYKTMDSNYNVTISAQFFIDYPNFFVKDEKGQYCTTNFSLATKVIQPQAAITIVDNATGAVKAMVGGRGTSGRMLYNRATTTRQSGSSIKPLTVYGAALQQSYELSQEGKFFKYWKTGFDNQGTNLWGSYITAASIVDDEPTFIEDRLWPVNSYNAYKGIYTLREALQQSVNVCAIKILSQVGVKYSYELAQKFGITTFTDGDINLSSLGVGGQVNGVTTLEMASAYTTFVNDGVHKSYYCYDKVTTKTGAVLLEPTKTETEVLNSGVAWIMRDLLQTVVSEGIGSNARVKNENVGGKTGTTTDKYDIWFDGFTANYSASLWIGNDVNISLSDMSGTAAKLWSTIMKQIPNALNGTYSAAPENVVTATIDTNSGLLATLSSVDTRVEYFTDGTQPTEAGTRTKTVLVCPESGYLATPYCTSVALTGLDRGYQPSHECEDWEDSIPYYYCPLHNPDPEIYPTETIYEYNEDGRIVKELDEEGNEITVEKTPMPDSPEDILGGNPDEISLDELKKRQEELGEVIDIYGNIITEGEEEPDL